MAMKKTITVLAAAGLSLAMVGVGSAQRAQRSATYPWQTGQDVYEHICQGCHMPDARGATGAGTYPALANNTKLQAGVYPVIVMLRGQKAMPSFADLTDAQIADVTNYIRSHFGNQYPGTITPDQVAKMRPQQIKRDAQRPG